MNINHMLSLALTGLMAATTAFADDAPATGDILEGINMFTPDENAPAYKKAANERFGTQWALDVAYGHWTAHHQPESELNRANYFLMHAQLNQRLIQDDQNGGTWLRVEFSGSWGLDRKSASKHYDAFNHCGVYGAHSDFFGPHEGLLPEVALMHYFAGKRACVIAGMVNLTNYFDAVGIANDSFATFTHNSFVNSSVLPLPDSNVGAVLQVELDTANYVMLGVSRTGAVYGQNPMTGGANGYCVVGEYGHIFHDLGLTLRVNPFVHCLAADDCADGRKHRNAGLAASAEYEINDKFTVFARAGLGAKQALGTTAEFSCGATARLIPSRPNDFLGVAYGVTKGRHTVDDEAYNRRETVIEAMYNIQITDSFKVMPHLQFIHDPAYRSGHGDEVVGGVQAVYSF